MQTNNNKTFETKAQKNRRRFMELLPRDGFTILHPEDFKEMLKIIQNEQDPKQQHVYFGYILDKMFACGWGWYGRLGQSLSGMRPIQHADQLSKSERADGLAVLRMVKDMHIKLNWRPSYISVINSYIREFGGKTVSREQQTAQRKEKFDKAAQALQTGEKMPRKMKKSIKAQLQKTR